MGGNTRLRPAGHIEISDPDRALFEADTLQCVHCGCHWEMRPGSGNVRGYCSNCHGPICGPKCVQCVPAEQKLENIEQGRPANFTKVQVPVKKLILPG